MALIEQGILGPFRGKCGNVIGYIRNGVFCMRAMPAHYRDRRSEAQMKNRGRFGSVMKMMSVVRPAITLGFNRFASAMTEMNVATRENYYSLVKEGVAGFVYDFAGLKLSRGCVEKLKNVMMTVTGSLLSLVWVGSDVKGGEGDKVSVVLVNGDRMEMRMKRAAAKRVDGGVNVTVPNGWTGEDVHCYVMVERGLDWSESCYVGGISAMGTLALHDSEAELIGPELDMKGDEVGLTSDQSAIKVLFDLPSYEARDGRESRKKEEMYHRRNE